MDDVVCRTVEEIRAKGVDISDSEIDRIVRFCKRKMEIASQPEKYFDLLFPDEIKDYLFRRCINNVSRILEEEQDVQYLYEESMRFQMS